MSRASDGGGPVWLAVLERFERHVPATAPAWRRQWEQVTPFYACPVEVRRMIHTTNASSQLMM